MHPRGNFRILLRNFYVGLNMTHRQLLDCIAKGNFYIHGAIQFGPRTIPLKDIRSIQVHRVRGRYGSGNRYMVYLERKKGRTITVIVGESARNCRLMDSLRADTRKYGIKVYGDI